MSILSKIYLYPTETVYGLGVNALDREAVRALDELKGRSSSQPVSWLVRDVADIRRYAEVSETATKIAERFLPGPLTLVLRSRDFVPRTLIAEDGTIGFRISSDPIAQKLIEEFMAEHDAPLTATSANVHGMPTMPTVREILAQFGDRQTQITRIIDDGPRTGNTSTMIRVFDDKVEILREGAISRKDILSVG